MAKMFCVDENNVFQIGRLLKRQVDQEYIILSKWDKFADIAQWCDKYQNVRIITVPLERLDKNMHLQ